MVPPRDWLTSWKTGSANGTYKYRPLESPSTQVRLVTIYRSQLKNAPINCELETVDAGSRHYEALSYVWGEQGHRNRHMIRIGLLGAETLAVSDNLFAALQHLRQGTISRTLWIDAICINQADTNEKTYQVRLMRDIYFNASRVLVWLGESDPDIDQAIDELVQHNSQPGKTTPLPDHHETHQALNAGLRKIVAFPWWTRMWVVQEVVAAARDPVVMCGRKSLPFDVLRESLMLAGIYDMGFFEQYVPATRGMYSFGDASALVFFNTLMPAENRGSREPRHNLAELLATTVERNATNSRDHVFALLGLVNTKQYPLRFQVDYTKSPSWAFQHAMVAVLEQQKSLEWLLFAVCKPAPHPNNIFQLHQQKIPSWCIDFSAKPWPAHAKARAWGADRWLTQGNKDKTNNEANTLKLLPPEVQPMFPPGSRHTGSPDHPTSASLGITLSSPIPHDPSRGTITLRGLEIGCITSFRASSTAAFREFREQKKSETSTEAEMRQALLDGALKIMEDTALCSILAQKALRGRMGREKADKEIAGGLVWKILSGGVNFDVLLWIVSEDSGNGSKGVDGKGGSIPDEVGYGCLEKTIQPGRIPPPGKQMLEDWQAWTKLLPELNEVPIDNFDSMAKKLLLQVAAMFGGSFFFVTDTGYVGCAGHAVQPGDLVCVLYGCRLPAVLRPQADGSYMLVTFTYTHDVMEGQFIGVSAARNFREFTLK